MSDETPGGEPTDMRRFRRQTELRLAVAIVLFLTVVGNALVWVFFGREVALTSLGCSLVGALLFVALYGVVWLLGRLGEGVWR